MRSLWGLATVFVLVAFGVFVWVQVNPTEPREDLCKQGAYLAQARLLDKAVDTYSKAKSDGQDCGKAIETVELAQGKATQFFAMGAIYAAAEIRRQAIARYATGLRIDPFDRAAYGALVRELNEKPLKAVVQCEIARGLAGSGLLDAASVALANGLPTHRKSCRRVLEDDLAVERIRASSYAREARQLNRAGRTETGRRQYAVALRTNAGLVEAQTSLEGSLNEESLFDSVSSWLAGITATMKTALTWLIPAAVIALLLAVGLWILVRELSAASRSARYAFEALGQPRVLGFLRKAATPTVKVTPFDGGDSSKALGSDFSNLLTVKLGKPAGREPPFPFDRAATSSPDDGAAAAVAGTLTEIPSGALLGALVKLTARLFRRRSVEVSGHLVPIADRGAGVTIAVTGAGIPDDTSVTIWEEHFDPLIGGSDAAARWLRLVPAATVWVRWQLGAAFGSAGNELEKGSWEADARFLCGLAWQERQDWGRAEAMYAGAIDEDPKLLTAALNLAVIETRSKQYDLAKARLTAIQADLQGDVKLQEHWPTLQTAVLYRLTLACAYHAQSTNSKARNEEARSLARELVGAIFGQLEDEEKLLDPAVRAELKLVELPSVVVLATVIARCTSDGMKDAIAGAIAKGPHPEIKREELLKNLSQVRPSELIEGYVCRQPNRNRRTYYNLACYFSTLAKKANARQQKACLRLALDSLDKALVGRGLESWAATDPSLNPLRDLENDKYTQIIKRHSPAAHK